MNWLILNAAYIPFIAVLIWGLKIAPAGKFHEDSMSFEASKCLLGLCALGVVLHHISQNKLFEEPKVLSFFVGSGVYFVALFFFNSGYGLIKSLDTKTNYLDSFMKKRIPSVVIPFYTMIFVYLILNIVLKTQMPVSKWICSVLGIFLINSHSWYPIEIAILYTGFYLIFRKFKDERDRFTVMGIFVLCVVLFGIFSGHYAWWMGKWGWWKAEGALWTAPWYKGVCALWFHGEWWVNSTIFLFVGMLFARFEKNITDYFKRMYWLKLVLAIIACAALVNSSNLTLWKVSYWSEMGSKNLDFNNKFICLVSHSMAEFSVILLLVLVRMKMYTVNPVAKFYGTLTLELYLMHNVFLILGDKFILNGQALADMSLAAKTNIFIVSVFLGGTLLGLLMSKLNKLIIRKIFR